MCLSNSTCFKGYGPLVPPHYTLLGKTPAEIDFRTTYGAAIIAMQRGGRKPEVGWLSKLNSFDPWLEKRLISTR